MSKIISVKDMRLMEEKTYEVQQISSFELMYHAGKYIFNYLREQRDFDKTKTTLIIAGTGNNGGDAIVVASKLQEVLYPVKVLVVGKKESRSKENIKITEQITQVQFISIHDDLHILERELKQANLVIDGLFGIGLNKDVKGLFGDVIDLVNKSKKQVISIDVPSGIDGDTGLVKGIAIKAFKTIAIQNVKFGNVLNDALDHNGELHVIDVGIEDVDAAVEASLLSSNDIYFNKRKHNTHKYHYGNLLTIGGSNGMMGAPYLSAMAALRSGCGLSHLYYNDLYKHLINVNSPDIMTGTYKTVSEIVTYFKRKSCIIFGPGLGRVDLINIKILRNILETDIPVLIDADGLYYYGKLMNEFKERGNIIITPHIKEFSDILDSDINFIKENTVLVSKEFAEKYNVTLVLKGSTTIITDGKVVKLNIDSTPALAVAGTGDVLSGIIGSFVGQKYSLLQSAIQGVYIHSEAGKKAEEDIGTNSVIASDLINYIPKVIFTSTNT